MNKGYALASPLISNPMTVSESDMKLRFRGRYKYIGLSMEGIPSFGGPPPFILSSGIKMFYSICFHEFQLTGERSPGISAGGLQSEACIHLEKEIVKNKSSYNAAQTTITGIK